MTAKIFAAFVAAQREFAPALKTASNPHFKTKYADLSACVEAVIDALHKNDIALMQPTYEDATGVTVSTMFLHTSGESMDGGKLHVPASKQDPQGYGSALTYARRYSLMAACGIAPEDDDGNAASRGKSAPSPADVAMQWIGALDQCQSMEQLKATFADAWKATKKHPAVQKHYDKLKATFESPAP